MITKIEVINKTPKVSLPDYHELFSKTNSNIDKDIFEAVMLQHEWRQYSPRQSELQYDRRCLVDGNPLKYTWVREDLGFTTRVCGMDTFPENWEVCEITDWHGYHGGGTGVCARNNGDGTVTVYKL